jgi:putative intracellular protease/amidase
MHSFRFWVTLPRKLPAGDALYLYCQLQEAGFEPVVKCRHDVESAGGIYVDEPCVVDGNLVSGRTYHDNGRYLGPWIRLLEEAAARGGSAQAATSPRRKPVG